MREVGRAGHVGIYAVWYVYAGIGGSRDATVVVEVLYFDGCPAYLGAENTLREVLARRGVGAVVELAAVNTDEEAQRLRFPGSPTIRVDGQDLFPVPERAEYAPGCRMYSTPEGLRGSPTAEMLSEALTNLREAALPRAQAR